MRACRTASTEIAATAATPPAISVTVSRWCRKIMAATASRDDGIRHAVSFLRQCLLADPPDEPWWT